MEKQEKEEKQSSVLLLDGKSNDGAKVSPDERFFEDESEKPKDVIEDEEEKPKKVFDKSFKKQIKKENRKAKIAFIQKRFLNFFKLPSLGSLFRLLDFSLNAFSIIAIIFGVVMTAHFLLKSNPYMVVAGCVFIFITIYLNEKIS